MHFSFRLIGIGFAKTHAGEATPTTTPTTTKQRYTAMHSNTIFNEYTMKTAE